MAKAKVAGSSTSSCTWVAKRWAMQQGFALDPVTFEDLKNSFIASVDQMAEQILRTCYSFVIYNRDFSKRAA